MIRAVANKPLELSDVEFQYYLLLVEAFGQNIFQDTFVSDEEPNSPTHGWITMVTPPFNGQLPMGVIFFLFNVMLNQRVRKFDEALKKVEGHNGK